MSPPLPEPEAHRHSGVILRTLNLLESFFSDIFFSSCFTIICGSVELSAVIRCIEPIGTRWRMLAPGSCVFLNNGWSPSGEVGTARCQTFVFPVPARIGDRGCCARLRTSTLEDLGAGDGFQLNPARPCGSLVFIRNECIGLRRTREEKSNCVGVPLIICRRSTCSETGRSSTQYLTPTTKSFHRIHFVDTSGRPQTRGTTLVPEQRETSRLKHLLSLNKRSN